VGGSGLGDRPARRADCLDPLTVIVKAPGRFQKRTASSASSVLTPL
jgi:hypothetical protein